MGLNRMYIIMYIIVLRADFPSIPRIGQREKEIIRIMFSVQGIGFFIGTFFFSVNRFLFRDKKRIGEEQKLEQKSRRYICILVKDRWKNSAVKEWTYARIK